VRLAVAVPFVVAAAALAGAGCAYRLAEPGGAPRPVAVVTLTNDTREPGVEWVVGAALRRELSAAGALRVVETPRPAGFVVGGRVSSVEVSGRTFTPGVRALEYTLTVVLDLAVSAPGGRLLAIDPFAESASEIYLASADVQLARKNREEALRRVADVLAARIRRELERAAAAEPAPAEPAGALGS
jgi:outer membrane lipopolysaccharide assembly protein LptE/RlpB